MQDLNLATAQQCGRRTFQTSSLPLRPAQTYLKDHESPDGITARTVRRGASTAENTRAFRKDLGTTTASQQQPQAFKRAVKKIKCAAMVANLAKSWQGWANEHSGKQDSIPSGWMPSSVEEDCEKAKKHVVKLNVTPRVINADATNPEEAKYGLVLLPKPYNRNAASVAAATS
ncbi:hypothetical protein WMY93_011447 [Mugilogobius chulae]|uniref:Uncharacterized protein n=1 Tax=Mugilogobius chulae TaxID=88201 RepID=A0AAW0P5X6_9GOBI